MRQEVKNDLSRRFVIHVCKDCTVTIRQPGQKVFNGVALPVFSTDTLEQADSIRVAFCRVIPLQHPKMEKGETWYKLARLGDGQDPLLSGKALLELEDLDGIANMFRTFWQEHIWVPPAAPRVFVRLRASDRPILDRLSKLHQQILEMDATGVQYKQGALSLGIPLGTYRSRLNRARSSLAAERLKP